jgi:GNAT superfamily N-acetyltransferase
MSLGNPERAVGGLAVRTPPGVELQPLARGDLADAVALARDLHGHPPIGDVEPLQPRLDALLNSPDVAPFVATLDGRTVGIGILQFRRRLNFPTFEGWLSELYVQPPARGRGIGRAMVDALVAEWRLRGGHRIQVQLPDQAESAAAILARVGFEPWMLDFRLRPIEVGPMDPPADLAIRPVRLEDGEAVTSLLSEFGPARTPDPSRGDAVQRTFADHARRVTAGVTASTVAELNGEIVGFCALEWQRPFWTDETHAWLPDLMVTESRRGRGIGRALLTDALVTAWDGGASQVTLESGPSRTAAHALYRSTGFEQVGRSFRLQRTEG